MNLENIDIFIIWEIFLGRKCKISLVNLNKNNLYVIVGKVFKKEFKFIRCIVIG